MRVSYRFRFLLPLFLIAALPLAADETAPSMADADAAYAERSDTTKARMALEMYQRLCEKNPSAESHWKAARAAWWVGDQTDHPKEKMNLFNLGIELAKEGIRLDPNSVESHFWLGGNYGSFGETKGVLKSLSLVKPIRQEMETVLKLNPTFDGGGAQRVLGVIDYKVPGFAGGNKKRAETRLMEAYAIDPQNPHTLYYLGEYYATVKKKDLARQYFSALETLEHTPENGPEIESLKKKAAALSSNF